MMKNLHARMWADGEPDDAPQWCKDLVKAVSRGYGVPLARVRVVPRLGYEWGGRYYPEHNAIAVIENSSVEFMHGILVHECAHWVLDRKTALCGDCHPGRHGIEFYAVVKRLYVEHRVRPSVAVRVEQGRDYPKEWEQISRW